MTTILNDVKLDFNDVLFVPQRSELASRSDVSLEKTYQFKHSKQTYTGIPIIAANMDGVGTMSMAKVLGSFGLMTSLVKHYSLDQLVTFFNELPTNLEDTVSYSLGISDEDLEKYYLFKRKAKAKYVTIDVANGYSEKFLSFVSSFREKNPDTVIIAGNVATPEIVHQLFVSGADIVKVGIGSGNACSTRIKTGVGYPQLSAILECANAAHGIHGHIISDGGITCPGDVAKAFGAGADFVMIGSFLAGCDEGEGTVITKRFNTNESVGHGVVVSEVKKHVEFYGMSSKTAQEKHGAGLSEYRASEGRVIKVPYKGPVEPILLDLLGGLRSACTYTGSKTLKELPRRTTFCRVNQQISTLYGVGELLS